MASPSEPQPQRVNRVLGATAGPDSGVVRAVLALLAMLFLHALFALLLVAYFKGAAAELKDFVLTTGTAIVTLDVGSTSYYFGRRSGEGA